MAGYRLIDAVEEVWIRVGASPVFGSRQISSSMSGMAIITVSEMIPETKIPAQESLEPSLYEEVTPMRRMMFLHMLWPIRTNYDGNVVTQGMCGASTYTALMYVFQSAWNLCVTGALLELLVNHSSDYREVVYYTLYVVLLSEHWCIPFVHWNEADSLAQYFNSWTAFQGEWRRVTRRPLRLNVSRNAMLAAAWSVAIPVVVVLAQIYLCADLPVHHAAILFPVASYFILTCANWLILCSTLARMAVHMSLLFRKAMEYRRLSAVDIRAYCDLWVHLRTLTAQTGSAQSLTMLHFLIFNLLTALVPGFGAMSALMTGKLSAQAAGQAIVMLNSLWYIHLVHDAAQVAVDKVSHSMQSELLRYKNDRDEKQLKEVQIFIRTIEGNHVEISLGGFTPCSRSAAIAVFNAFLINLLVLLQFVVTTRPDNDNPTAAQNMTLS